MIELEERYLLIVIHHLLEGLTKTCQLTFLYFELQFKWLAFDHIVLVFYVSSTIEVFLLMKKDLTFQLRFWEVKRLTSLDDFDLTG